MAVEKRALEPERDEIVRVLQDCIRALDDSTHQDMGPECHVCLAKVDAHILLKELAESSKAKEGHPCECVCHKAGLLGFMCCPCTTRIFQAVADEGGNNVAIRPKVSHVPEQRMEVGQERRSGNQRGNSMSPVRDDSHAKAGASGDHSVAVEPTGQAQANICPRCESHYRNFKTLHCIADTHKWHSEEGRKWPREAQEAPPCHDQFGHNTEACQGLESPSHEVQEAPKENAK